ncbi:alpha/beta hydrolase [Amycolatopsis sp. NPDC059021]|uniref:alpha/beta hydrolase n=1 Tax=Amycolatopsis sp. NPDC059021 TaxID=3346704 RepID=UPI00366AF733
MRRSLLSGAVVLALAAPLLIAAPASASPPAIDWKPCADAPGVDCARLAVPLDWAKPGGERIELSLARRKGTGTGEKLGTLMYGPGGPGGAGAKSLKHGKILADPVYDHYDVISYDSRGIGDSKPIACPDGPEPRGWPATEEQFRDLTAKSKQYIADCRKLSGPIYDHVDTRSDVRDMDAIRAAIGERKLNYYGVSYGTLRGQQYAEFFPRNVGRLVLDSTMDHSMTSNWDFVRTESVAREEVFRQFVRWCADKPECALHGQDVEKLVRELYDRADAGTLPDPDDPAQKYDGPRLAAHIESYTLSEEFAVLGTFLKTLRDSGTKPELLAAAPTAPNPTRAIWCNDWAYRVSGYEEFKKLDDGLRKVSPNIRFNGYNPWALVCAGQPAPVNPPHKLTLSRDVPPLLITNARHDPATAYPWAKSMEKQTGMTLVTYDGGGHGMYFVSKCSREYIHQYLFTGAVPPRGTHCAVEPRPASARADLPVPPDVATF